MPLAKSLAEWLGNDYAVSRASDGAHALKILATDSFDLLILDLGLPDMSGQDLCHQVRLNGTKVPILVLTASSEVSMKVTLLDIGADDYLIKPFYVGELKARLRALLRRDKADNTASDTIRVGDLVLNRSRRQVDRGDLPINLRRKEFEILEYLMQNHGTVVTRSMIINNIWDDTADHWNNTVDVHIKYLRDKVDRPFKQKLIKTVYGVGYMIDNGQ